jgi:hypothetical protein
VQGADGVVELLAAFVVATQPLAQHFEQPRVADVLAPVLLGSNSQRLQRVEQAAGIAIGVGDQPINGGVVSRGDGVNG